MMMYIHSSRDEPNLNRLSLSQTYFLIKILRHVVNISYSLIFFVSIFVGR